MTPLQLSEYHATGRISTGKQDTTGRTGSGVPGKQDSTGLVRSGVPGKQDATGLARSGIPSKQDTSTTWQQGGFHMHTHIIIMQFIFLTQIWYVELLI